MKKYIKPAIEPFYVDTENICLSLSIYESDFASVEADVRMRRDFDNDVLIW